MIALLLFHLRVGVRVALRASPPLFCGILAVIMFQDPPGAAVASLARAVFAQSWFGSVIPIAAIAFLLSAWGRQRLAEGQRGWIRHLSVSRRSHRAGMFLALVSVQLPLFITLGLLAWTGKRQGLAVAGAMARFSLVCVTAASCHLSDRPRRAANWSRSHALLNWHITWRALGWRGLSALLPGAACIGIGWLFVVNNSLTGPIASAATRLGGAVGCAFCLSSLSQRIGIRRPSWPLARSFPWSATRRIVEDSSFGALCVLPLVLLTAYRDLGAAFMVVTVVPLLSVRCAEYIRRTPEQKVASISFLGEGVVISIVLTLVPWSAALFVLGTIPALYSAREFEKNRKATVWFELHHASAGDSGSWSE